MNPRRSTFLFAALLLVTFALWHPGRAVGANGGGMTPVLPPTGPFPPPASTPRPMGPILFAPIPVWPSDFQFRSLDLMGEGFQPGERVTISADHVTLPRTTVTADTSGYFTVALNFIWDFCEAQGATQPAPVFHAQGSMGSAAALALAPPACPLLVASLPRVEPPGGPEGTPGIGTGTVGAGTAVAGTAIVVPPQRGTPAPFTPKPWPTFPPIRTTNIVQGFGFVPAEQVSITEVNAPGPVASPVLAAADGQGRFRASVTVSLPGPCSPTSLRPELRATGDKGSSALGTPASPPLPEYACPALVVSPSPSPPTQASAATLAVLLRPVTARAGTVEHASVVAPGAGQLHLLVRYPGHRTVRWTVTVGTTDKAVVRWRIPRGTHHGVATLRVGYDPGRLVLDATFRVT